MFVMVGVMANPTSIALILCVNVQVRLRSSYLGNSVECLDSVQSRTKYTEY